MPSIKYKKKTYAGATFPVLEMTKAEYDALPEAKKMDGTVYMITDDTGGWEAENASYDNTESGLTATNVQDALDEIKSTIINIGTLTDVQPTVSGNISTAIPNSKRILNAWINNSTGYIVVPWKTTYTSGWYFHIYDTSGNTVTSQPTISQLVYAYVENV